MEGKKKIKHERLDHYHIDFILKPIRPKNLIGLFFEIIFQVLNDLK